MSLSKDFQEHLSVLLSRVDSVAHQDVIKHLADGIQTIADDVAKLTQGTPVAAVADAVAAATPYAEKSVEELQALIEEAQAAMHAKLGAPVNRANPLTPTP